MITSTILLIVLFARSSLGFTPVYTNQNVSPGTSSRTCLITTLHAGTEKQEREDTGTSQNALAPQQSRRSMIFNALNMASFVATATMGAPPSNAGLVQFPCDDDLMNTYHFIRAGESMLESKDLISTNPLFMTNREDALSPLGQEQIQTACHEMMMKDINPSVVKYSLAAKSMDTANMVAEEMQVGRNRLVPEYTFMDPRGVGEWNMRPLSQIEEAVWAMDSLEAGKEGKGGRPPPTDDGSANEVLSEQVIRLRQLMSVLETQFSGDSILLIFGDGTSPALLTALIAGLPLNRVHELNFEPGEIRYDITKSSILASMPDDISAVYLDKISRGKETLKELREELNRQPVENLQETYPVAVLREPRNPVAALREPRNKVEQRERNIASSEGSASDYFFPAVAVGLYMYANVGNSNASSSDEIEISKDTSVLDNVEVVKGDDNSLPPEIQKMENLVTAAPFEIPEFAQMEESKAEKVKRANHAMANYMSRDDGGEEWIAGLASIMDED